MTNKKLKFDLSLVIIVIGAGIAYLSLFIDIKEYTLQELSSSYIMIGGVVIMITGWNLLMCRHLSRIDEKLESKEDKKNDENQNP